MDQKINSGIFQLNLLFRQLNSKMLSIDFKSFLTIFQENPREILKQTKDLQSEVNLFLNRFEFYLRTINREIHKFKSGKDIETQQQPQGIIEIDIHDQKQQKLKIKQPKRITKKPVFQDNFSDMFCIAADFVEFSNKQIKISKYEKICQTIFDSYSVLNLKIPNMSNNKELFEKILYITWKLVNTQGQMSVQYENCQSVVGYPKIFPFNYSQKGSLMKKLKNEQEQSTKKKHGMFTDERVEKEFEKILIKIQEHSQNLFDQIATQKTSLICLENQQIPSQHQIQTSAKNIIQKKISLFKINFLSGLLIKFITNQDIKSIDVDTNIDIEQLKRPKLENYLKTWKESL